MAGKKGRKSYYDLYIEPKLDEIRKWRAEGHEERDIYDNLLHISKTTFYKYKAEKKELADVLKDAHAEHIREETPKLYNSLERRAHGFYYTETRRTIVDGEVVKEEEHTKYCPPDVAALNLLLKNYDAERWANDPQMIELRKKEIELKEKALEKDDW